MEEEPTWASRRRRPGKAAPRSAPIPYAIVRNVRRLNVNGDDFRGKTRGKFERLPGNLVPALNGHHSNGPRGFVRRDHGRGAARSHSDHVIVTPHDAKQV